MPLLTLPPPTPTSNTFPHRLGNLAGRVAVEWSPTTGPTDPPVWVDITTYVHRIEIRRGRNNDLDRFEAGTAVITLNNDSRLFDPLYTAGAYYGNLLPMRLFRIRGQYSNATYPMFVGYTEAWQQQYTLGGHSTAEVSLVDAFKIFAMQAPKSPYSATIERLDPTAWYRMSEENTTVMIDSGPNGYDGTYYNTPTLGVAGLIESDANKAVTFTAASSEYAAVTSIPQYVIGTGLLIGECWFKTTAGTAGTFLLNTESHGYPQFELGITSAGLIVFSLYFPPYDLVLTVTTTAVFNDGNPHHASAAVYPGDAAGTAVLEFNVDGVRIYVPSGAFTYSWGSPSSRGAPNSWFVGSRGGTSTFFDGTLDEATIYVTPVRWPFTSISDFSNFIAAKEELLTHYEAGSNPWNGDLAGERVVHILDVMEWPDSERDISTGAVTLQAANFGANSIYEEFARIMLTELGRLFIDRQGRVALDGRYDASGAVSQATFGDGVGEVPYTAMLIDYDEALLTNSILAQRDNGTEFVISDTDSQGTYYPRSYSASGLLYQDDDQTAGFARVVLSRRKDPVIRVTMTITADANPALCYPQVLGREIGNVGTFKRRPQSIGTAISQDCTIDAISHDITPDWWITTFEGTQAYINDFWTLGDSVAGVLGVTTALGF